MRNKIRAFCLLWVFMIFLSACDQSDTITTDSGNTYIRVPAEVMETVNQTKLRQFKVKLVSEQKSATYQQERAYASGSVSQYGGGYSYFGPLMGSKGLLRVLILESNDPFISEEDTVIFKTIDLKTIMLWPGDIVKLTCKVDYEFIPPETNNTVYTPEAMTFEIDDCKMDIPVIGAENNED